MKTTLIPFKPGIKAWPEPDLSILGDNLPNAPKPNLGCLTNEWRQWVQDAAASKSCPVDFVLGGLLVSAAALLSGKRSASPWEGWSEPAILWAAMVGNPSSGKSPALDTVLSPLREIEAEWSSDFEQVLRQHMAAVEHSHAIKDQWRDAMQEASKSGSPIPELPLEAMEPKEPQQPRLVTSDSTIEKLALILSGNRGHGLLSYRDELSGWFLNFERRGGSDRAFWVESYGGRPFTVDRVKNSVPIQVDSLAVSILGATQPDKLRTLTTKHDDDGMAARFMFFYPDGAPPFRRPSRVVDGEFVSCAFSRLASIEAVAGENGRWSNRTIRFSPGAADVLEKWRSETFPRLERMARGLLLSAIGKMPGMVVRLALIFDYLEWASERDRPEPLAISASAVESGIEFIEQYAIPMARRALAAGSQSNEERNAALIAQWLLDTLPKRVNLRDLSRSTPGFPVCDPKALAVAAPLVVDAGFWRPLEAATGGRRRKDYEISPYLASAKSPKTPKSYVREPFGPFGPFGEGGVDPERAAIMAIDGGAI